MTASTLKMCVSLDLFDLSRLFDEDKHPFIRGGLACVGDLRRSRENGVACQLRSPLAPSGRS